MNIIIIPKALSGTIKAIPSKSYSHRYLIAAGLAQEPSTIKNILMCEDILATKQALMSLGGQVENNKVFNKKLRMVNSVIDAKHSASTLRFLIPLTLLLNQEITFIGSGELPKRPLEPYIELFKQKSIYYTKPKNKHLPLTVKGKLKGGHYQIKGDVSSQFISGLLFALPLLSKDSVIELLTPLESKGYVELTLSVLKEFGIHILKVDQYYYIKGSQKYQALDTSIEGDFSQSAFWMIAGLIGKTIQIKDLNPKSLQGDREIIKIITQMGGYIKYRSPKSYLIAPSKTTATTIDLSQIPDLGPILMVLAALSQGVTTFTNTYRLRLKETDRIKAMQQVLTKFGVDIKTSDDKVVIKGQDSLIGNQAFDCFGDHRIAMAIAIAAIRADGVVTILNAEAVNKSYPTFFESYKLLGGNINES